MHVMLMLWSHDLNMMLHMMCAWCGHDHVSHDVCMIWTWSCVTWCVHDDLTTYILLPPFVVLPSE
jgi:hypothetical protein